MSQTNQSRSITEMTVEERLRSSQRIRDKYPGHFPVYVTRYEHCRLPEIQKNKYLVPGHFTMGQVIFLVRKRITLRPSDALFLYVCTDADKVLAATGETIDGVFERHRKEDGLLYLQYATENTFGAGSWPRAPPSES